MKMNNLLVKSSYNNSIKKSKPDIITKDGIHGSFIKMEISRYLYRLLF